MTPFLFPGGGLVKNGRESADSYNALVWLIARIWSPHINLLGPKYKIYFKADPDRPMLSDELIIRVVDDCTKVTRIKPENAVKGMDG